MAIRLSGMSSGLDTDAIVTALVSSYKQKVDKSQQAQTKLSYKTTALKDVNSDVYNLFKTADSLRWSSAYSLKSTSVSDTTKAKVTASNNATNGTQQLKITQLAQAGYLTGGAIKTDSGKVTTSSKLGDLYTENSDKSKNSFSGAGSITVKVDGKETQINISESMTVNSLMGKLKDVGLNASFDENYGRFFISSKSSGAENDFSIVANDSAAMAGLQALGLYTADATSKATYQQWGSYTDSQIEDMAQAEYDKVKSESDAVAKSYYDRYSAALATIDALNDANVSYDEAKANQTRLRSELETTYAAYSKKDENGVEERDDKGNLVFDESLIPEGQKEAFNELSGKVKNIDTVVSSYEAQQDILKENEDYVVKNPDGTVSMATAGDGSAAWSKIDSEVSSQNADTLQSIKDRLYAKRDYNKEVYDNFDSISTKGGAVRIEGQDAKIELNGVEFTGSSNNFNINGLTIEATAVTKPDEAITITTSTDTQGLYDKIKDFFSQYNDIVNKISKLYNAESAKGYDPLTEEQKEEMSDTEIEKWEQKIKDSILRKDSTLGNILNTITSSMSNILEIGGEKVSLSTFGIKTAGYFASSKNENYAYHIDGDADDSFSSGNADKLLSAIAENPEKVANFFQELTSGLYKTLNNAMKSSSLSSAYTIYNDKQMASEYSDYTKTISKWQNKMTDMENAYYKKFTAMEKTLAQLQSSTSSLTGMMG